jgi:hypothetical protein
MCVYCEATCVVLELTFVKMCHLFFVYGSCRKKRNVCNKKKQEKKKKNRRKEPRAHSAEKSPSPLFYPLFLLTFCRISAASSFSYSLEFSLLILLPLECVLLENPANIIL